MEKLIQPKVLKGFRDILPRDAIRRDDLQEKITKVYRSFGFVPIDTPALEYSEILLRKSEGETEKQVFRFTDNGKRDVALRFDLTVPFARFTAEHSGELYFPFKRYHMAKVWRGEKPQAGRYREFIQCDIDIIGSDSAASDFEILNVMREAFLAIGVSGITIRVNHRGIFNRFLLRIGQIEKSEAILRAVDKLAKVGREEVGSELAKITDSDKTADLILRYVGAAGEKEKSDFADWESTLALIEDMAGGEDSDSRRMREIRAMMSALGIEASYVLDSSVTRGLDYYTGVVYETFLNELPSIGSVCSGGRYDNLAGLYMKNKVPGVGASIGLDRLLSALDAVSGTMQKPCYIDAEIFCLDEKLAVHYQKAASDFRKRGVSVEVFPHAAKMNRQYVVTDAKNIPWGILIDEEAAKNNVLSLKNLAVRKIEAENVTIDSACEKIKAAKNENQRERIAE